MYRCIALLFILSVFSETQAQTCDLVLAGYTPPAVDGGIHQFVVQFANAENCGCNDYTLQDGNDCEDSTNDDVQNNESVSHLVFGLHYVDEVTGEDLGENTDCTSTNFHPGWSYGFVVNGPPGGWQTGSATTIGINPPFSWECILNNPIDGYCWEVVIWQINLSQTAGYDDFPFPEGWSAGSSFNNTQMYPDINLSDNRITFCPDPVVTDTVYVYETDTVFVNLPPDTIYVPWEWYIYDTVYVDVFDTIVEYSVDTLFQEVVVTEYITETDTIYEYTTELIDCDTGLPCEDGFWEEDCRSVFVPNAFSPNNDGVNDAFYVLSESFTCWESWRLQVYNRWGDLIWQSNDPDEFWYGQVKNGNHFVADGVYVWVLQAQGYDALTLDLQGSVTVFR